MLLFALSAYAASPPTTQTQFCAHVCEWITVNGTSVGPPKKCFDHCIDGIGLRWSRNVPGGAHQIFNGTDLFSLTANASASGGYECERQYKGRDRPTSLPYTMVALDNGSAFNRTESLDNVSGVDMWSHYRPGQTVGPLRLPGQEMYWHVAPSASDGAPREVLRTSCVQKSFQPHAQPGDMQSGERDFSEGYTTTLPDFTVPKGVKCEFPANAFVPSDACAPKCAEDSLCCIDPTEKGSGATCFNVGNCAQLPGTAVLGASFEQDDALWFGATFRF